MELHNELPNTQQPPPGMSFHLPPGQSPAPNMNYFPFYMAQPMNNMQASIPMHQTQVPMPQMIPKQFPYMTNGNAPQAPQVNTMNTGVTDVNISSQNSMGNQTYNHATVNLSIYHTAMYCCGLKALLLVYLCSFFAGISLWFCVTQEESQLAGAFRTRMLSANL